MSLVPRWASLVDRQLWSTVQGYTSPDLDLQLGYSLRVEENSTVTGVEGFVIYVMSFMLQVYILYTVTKYSPKWDSHEN